MNIVHKTFCGNCELGRIACQRCKNGTPEGDKYFEQGGWTMGCRDCHGYAYRSCECQSSIPGITREEFLEKVQGWFDMALRENYREFSVWIRRIDGKRYIHIQSDLYGQGVTMHASVPTELFALEEEAKK